MRTSFPLKRFWQRFKQSRRQGVLLLLGGTTLLVSAIAVGSYSVIRAIILNSLREQAFLELQQGGGRIDQWLATRKAEMTTLAHSPPLGTMDWTVAGSYLKAEIQRLKSYKQFAYALPDGSYYTTKVDRAQGKTVSDRRWFREGMQGKTYVSDPLVSRTSGESLVYVATPIPAGARTGGVLAGAVGTQDLAEIVGQLHPAPGSFVFVLNSEGRAIVHPDPALQGTIENPAPPLTEAKEPLLAAVAQKMVDHKRGVQLTQMGNQWNYVFFMPLEQSNWSIGLVIPWKKLEDKLYALNLLAGVLGILLLVAMVGVWRRVQQAEQLRQTLRELQNTQSQLIQNEKMSSLGQLVAGVAHEINNPVNFIHGNLVHASEYTEGLLELLRLYEQHYPSPPQVIQNKADELDLEFITEDLPKLLNSMQVGADRIRQIVLSLRNFSRLDESDMKAVDIHAGIDSTLMILQNRIKARPDRPGIEIIREYGKLPAVECYAGQLNQVFMNILSNAIDVLEEQKKSEEKIQKEEYQRLLNTPGFREQCFVFDHLPAPTITICTAVQRRETKKPDATLPDQDSVVIRIQDNGSGMPPEVKAQIFNPFFTTKAIGKGTGLGLAISYQIVVEKHGGVLNCVSEPGSGTEFWIEIPVKQKRTGTDKEPTSGIKNPAEPSLV